MIKKIWVWIGTLFTIVFGGQGKILTIICMFIILDFLTGMWCSAKNGIKWSSKRAKDGLYSKVGLIGALMFGYLADEFIKIVLEYNWTTFDIPTTLFFGTLTAIYVALTECISILENLNNINPKILPQRVRRFFENAYNKLNEESEEEKNG